MVMATIHDDDNVVGGITTGDWVSPPPPPRPPTPLLEDDDDDDDAISSKLISEIPTTPPVSGQKKNSGSCLSERVSARAGFTAPPRLNTESIVMENNAIRSPYLTIPPGLSPTTLLDSPIFLSNSQVQTYLSSLFAVVSFRKLKCIIVTAGTAIPNNWKISSSSK